MLQVDTSWYIYRPDMHFALPSLRPCLLYVKLNMNVFKTDRLFYNTMCPVSALWRGKQGVSDCKQGFFFLFQGQNSLQFEVQRFSLINICLHKHKYISRGNLLFKAGIKGFQACKIEQKLKAFGNIKALVYKPSIFVCLCIRAVVILCPWTYFFIHHRDFSISFVSIMENFRSCDWW